MITNGFWQRIINARRFDNKENKRFLNYCYCMNRRSILHFQKYQKNKND